jgi:hypothetical protein
MPGWWVWVLATVGVAAVLAMVVWRLLRVRRTRQLRDRFGPEYDRAAERAGSRSEAEAELAGRERRRSRLEIRPLSEAARSRFLEDWRSVQARFVDDPRAAATQADSLIQALMAERGYPVEGFEQRAADVSVDHPTVVENYRRGHRLARASDTSEDGSTESLRQAMRHYRALFDELLDADANADADAPLARDHSLDQRVAAGERRGRTDSARPETAEGRVPR